MMDAVRKAQTAFTAVYGCTYPLCSNVQMGLREIFQCTYRGSQQDFEAYFVQPTLDLLNHLTEKGFPLLIEDGQVVVHLATPPVLLQSGEMFFQVGRTTPGTLSLKFTKYKNDKSSEVISQPSEVERQEYHRAFTQDYLSNLRKAAGVLGDQLMRILIVSVAGPGDPSIWNPVKKESKRIMTAFRPRTGSTPSQHDEGHATLPAPSGHAGRPVTPQPVQESEQESEDVTQTKAAPVQVSNSESAKEENQPIADAAEVLLPDPDFPPLKDSMSRDAVTLSESHATLKYPPAHVAVRSARGYNGEDATAVSGEAVQSNPEVGPKYPPIKEAVRTNAPEAASGQEAGSGDSNHAYPFTRQAVGSKSESPSACSGGSSGQEAASGHSNHAYLPARQAVGPESESPSTAVGLAPGDSSRTEQVKKILYPPPSDGLYRFRSTSGQSDANESSNFPPERSDCQASSPPVGDAASEKSGGTRKAPYPSAADAVRFLADSSAKYPPVAVAVKDQTSARHDKPHIMDHGPSSPHPSHPNTKYPPAADAVKADSHACVRNEAGMTTQHRDRNSAPPCGPLPNAQCLVADDAVRRGRGGQFLAGTGAVNPVSETSGPKYPLVTDAVGGDERTGSSDAAGAAAPYDTRTGKVAFPEAVGLSESSQGTAPHGPKYPPTGQAVKALPHATVGPSPTNPPACPKSVSSGAAMPSSYPPVGAAVQESTSANAGVMSGVESTSVPVSADRSSGPGSENHHLDAGDVTDDCQGTLTAESTEGYQKRISYGDSDEAGSTLTGPETQNGRESLCASVAHKALGGNAVQTVQIQPGVGSCGQRSEESRGKAYPAFLDDENNSLF